MSEKAWLGYIFYITLPVTYEISQLGLSGLCLADLACSPLRSRSSDLPLPLPLRSAPVPLLCRSAALPLRRNFSSPALTPLPLIQFSGPFRSIFRSGSRWSFLLAFQLYIKIVYLLMLCPLNTRYVIFMFFRQLRYDLSLLVVVYMLLWFLLIFVVFSVVVLYWWLLDKDYHVVEIYAVFRISTLPWRTYWKLGMQCQSLLSIGWMAPFVIMMTMTS